VKCTVKNPAEAGAPIPPPHPTGTGSAETGGFPLAARPSRTPVRIRGSSLTADRLEFQIERAAQSDSCILVTGETGSGKEGVARAIHAAGPRRDRPFVAINCAALTTTLAESQLFGHVKGSFTGAVGSALGVFRAGDGGIVFLDEIDKIASRDGHGPDVSRQGVQRDLLPLVEGTTVSTRHGLVKTDHILFIASGAFHLSKPSDLIPELQGRLPIRVELDALTVADFERILTATDACLTRQYEALLATEGITLQFNQDGIRRLAELAWQVNERTENIGARRLHTVMEKLLEQVSFAASTYAGAAVQIDSAYVDERLAGLAASDDLARYVL